MLTDVVTKAVALAEMSPHLRTFWLSVADTAGAIERGEDEADGGDVFSLWSAIRDDSDFVREAEWLKASYPKTIGTFGVMVASITGALTNSLDGN